MPQCGEPRRADGAPCRLSVCALGKCGGAELGFASDIELMFIFEADGETTGPERITSAEFFQRLVDLFRKSIHARRQGIFEVDLRLRPYGKAGSLAGGATRGGSAFTWSISSIRPVPASQPSRAPVASKATAQRVVRVGMFVSFNARDSGTPSR